ncbi:MAG: mismatch-specific DNA-glycosylase, partial [Actinomycetales bacterium]
GSGFTPRLLDPSEERELLDLGLGITNVAARASARADELTQEELRAGGRLLREKVLELRPHWLAVLGIGAYRVAFDAPKAVLGEQPLRLGETRVWALPNPSGLNAHFTLPALTAAFAELRGATLPRDPG